MQARSRGSLSSCRRLSRAQQRVWLAARPRASPQLADGPCSTEFEGQLPSVQFGEDGVVGFQRPATAPRVEAWAGARPIVILPGFGNNTQDYEAPFGDTQAGIAAQLRARGFAVSVVQLERLDWVRVARALFTRGFWNSSLSTDPGYTWYLNRVHDAVLAALAQAPGAQQVDLVGHSAGGWLARAYLGDPKYFPRGSEPPAAAATSAGAGSNADEGPGAQRVTAALPSLPPLTLTLTPPGPAAAAAPPGAEAPQPPRPNPLVHTLVTLGTPQRPPPPGRVRDVTGGASATVHHTFPGAFFRDQGVRYLTVCGLTVRGRREVGADGAVVYDKQRPRVPAEYAYDSYEQVCAEGQGVVGDAVVPLRSAFLAGARQLVLPGVWHSMSRIGTFEEPSSVPWYGCSSVVDLWLAGYKDEAAA